MMVCVNVCIQFRGAWKSEGSWVCVWNLGKMSRSCKHPTPVPIDATEVMGGVSSKVRNSEKGALSQVWSRPEQEPRGDLMGCVSV